MKGKPGRCDRNFRRAGQAKESSVPPPIRPATLLTPTTEREASFFRMLPAAFYHAARSDGAQRKAGGRRREAEGRRQKAEGRRREAGGRKRHATTDRARENRPADRHDRRLPQPAAASLRNRHPALAPHRRSAGSGRSATARPQKARETRRARQNAPPHKAECPRTRQNAPPRKAE